MKKLILFIIFSLSLFGAEIEKSYYENINNKKFYQDLEKSILESEKKKEFSKEIINTQLVNLKRLNELVSKEVTIEEFNTKEFNGKTISMDVFHKYVLFLSSHKQKIIKQKSFLEDVQNRLSFFKKSIENIIEEDKENLLSYQLQFAYYRIQKNNIELRIKKLEEYRSQLIELAIKSISKVENIDLVSLNKLIDDKNNKINKELQNKISLEIDLEKENINENSDSVKEIENRLSQISNKINRENISLVDTLIKKILLSFKNNEQNSFLDTYSIFKQEIQKLDEIDKNEYLFVDELFKELAKDIFGNTQLIFGSSLSHGKDILNQIWSQLSSPLFVFNEQAISILSLVKAVFFIIIGFVIGIVYKKWLLKISQKWPNMSQMSLKLTSNVGFYLIIIITFMITMSSLGIDMSSISLIAGALSIGIGFGLQTVVSNLIAGIILMFERTIRIGDIIEISDLLKGTVTDIRIRSTTIKTFDNIDIVVPNSSFIQNNVINWTLEDPSRRLHIPFGVAYGTEVEKVKEVILSELEKSDLKYIRNNEDKKPEIRMELMNASSVDFELLVWIKANDRLQPNSLKSDFLILIYNSLYKHGIEIPFPQLDLHMKK